MIVLQFYGVGCKSGRPLHKSMNIDAFYDFTPLYLAGGRRGRPCPLELETKVKRRLVKISQSQSTIKLSGGERSAAQEHS